MRARHASKYRVSSSRTSSGSRDSEIGVKPTRSAKSTETSRRSGLASGAGGAGSAARGAGAVGTPASIRSPHSPQKANWGSLGVPHDGQARESRVPHDPQNLRPAGLSVPHAEQRMPPTPSRRFNRSRGPYAPRMVVPPGTGWSVDLADART